MKALLYCTKEKPYLYKTHFVKVEDVVKGINDKFIYETDNHERFYLSGEKRQALNGFIVAECEIDKVGLIKANYYDDDFDSGISYGIDLRISNKFERDSCLSYDDLYNYLGGNDGYALHLSNIKVFDKPRKLSKYLSIHYINSQNYALPIRKAPQNMCYYYDTFKQEKYILISIKPQWLCKILNGEKTIEVRKQILKCLKEMIK